MGPPTVKLQSILFRESIRSRTFDWGTFKKIDPLNTDAQADYAKKHLQLFGTGGTRLVFLLSSKKVLKLDYSGRQNRSEWATDNKSNLTPKMFDADKKYFKWIVVELVNPLTFEVKNHVQQMNMNVDATVKFEELSGIPWDDLPIYIGVIRSKQEVNYETVLAFVNKQYIPPPSKASITKASSSPLMTDIQTYVHRFGGGDMLKIDHWGTTPDGQLRFLDPGVAKRGPLTERLRSASLFNWKDFLEDDNKLLYAKGTLEEVDEGGSRTVFILDPKRVLKIDRYDQVQNEKEWRIGEKGSPITPKVYWKAHDYSWIVVELIRPIAREKDGYDVEVANRAYKEFESLSGFTWDEFVVFVQALEAGVGIDGLEEFIATMSRRTTRYKAISADKLVDKIENSKWVVKLGEHIAKFGTADMLRLDHWGKNSNGELVFLDPGIQNAD